MLPTTSKEESTFKDEREVHHGTGLILVADDEEVMRVTSKQILENLGYTVILAENGKDAVDLFSREKEKIDLVLLDMIMPIMSGRDCFEQLKKLDPEVTVILSSGFSKEEDLNEMRQNGLSGFICKPYLISALSKVVHEAMGKSTVTET